MFFKIKKRLLTGAPQQLSWGTFLRVCLRPFNSNICLCLWGWIFNPCPHSTWQRTKFKEYTRRWEWYEISSHQHIPKNFKISCTAASSVVPLISMGALCYEYECNVNTVNVTSKMMCFYLAGCYLNPFRLAVNGWGRALMSYIWMGLRAYVIFSNGVASWKGWEPLL